MSNLSIRAPEWHFDEYFDPLPPNMEVGSAVKQGRLLVSNSRIESHPFFKYARMNKSALVEWAKQECVVTNHFSLALFSLMSRIKNVHVRALLMPVIAGEHGVVREGVARHSHPHLLAKLVRDLEVDTMTITPLPFTVDFVEALLGDNDPPLHGFGVLGVGNEALLIPEYVAVEAAFDVHFPASVHRQFLRANIEEDRSHSDLMELGATVLIKSDQDENTYLDGARRGIAARIRYYDELLSHIRRI